MAKRDEHRLLSPIETVLKGYRKSIEEVELIRHPEFEYLANGFRSVKRTVRFHKPVDITDTYCNVVHDGIFRFAYYKLPKIMIRRLKSFLHKPIEIYMQEIQRGLPVIIHADHWFEISFVTRIKRIKLLIDAVPHLKIKEVDSKYYEFHDALRIELDSISIYAKTYQYKAGAEVMCQTTAESAIKLVAGNWQCLLFSTDSVFTSVITPENENEIDPISDHGFKMVKILT
jgi:hypothetical protein